MPVVGEESRHHPEGLGYVFGSLWQHRRLVLRLTRRDVVGRYRGSFMGLLWSLVQPLLMLGVYTFVFGTIFKARWGTDTGGGNGEFAIVLFTGLLVFGLFSECVNRAPSLVLARANFVKRVVFPLEILPWVALGSSVFHMAVNLIVLLTASLIVNGSIPPTWPLIIVVLVPMLLLTLGMTWLLAALGVYVRDVAHTVGVITTMLLFLCPVFYPLAAVPQGVRRLFELNPLTFIIEEARKVLLWGTLPDVAHYLVYLAGSLVVAWFGLFAFQRARAGFADVL